MAGLGRKVFTAGDVLTASDVQNYLMDQTVMNFAGTAARSSAIATPTTGMTTYNQTTQQLESYNGTAYVGMSGLQLVKKQTVGSAVSSVTVTGAFSATYDYYKIIYTNGVGSASGGINVSLGATTTGYYWGTVLGRYDNGGSIAAGGSNVASWFNMGFTDTNGNFVDIDLSMPFLTRKTGIQGAHWDTRTGGGTGYGTSGGHLADTTSYTSFTLTPSSGTITGGTIYVYGYGQ